MTSNRGKFFSIIADEVTDTCSSNNHTVCHRILDYNHLHHPVIKEVVYDFVQLERTNSETVCEKLIECHTSRSIDLIKVQAQTYDTISSMSSAVGGLHGRIKALYQKAIYLPCNAHILNLCISLSCKMQPVRNVIDDMNEFYLFYRNSPKRQAFLENCS